MTTSFPTTLARRTLVGALALLAGVLCVFAGTAHALPTNTGGGNGEPQNVRPTARFTISPNPALVSQLGGVRAASLPRVIDVDRIDLGAVSFNGSASTDDTGIAKYDWDLDGNGTYETHSGTNPKTSRGYTSPGTYTIRLRVTDDDGATDVEQHTLIVHRRPQAHISASAPVALIGDTLSYSAAGSSDDNGIARYEWDLDGNGSYETNTGLSQTTSRSYGSIGQRTIGLKVTDIFGATGTASVNVLVHRPPTAAFTFAPSPAFTGEQVTFDGSSSNDDEGVAKYEWDLDGNGSFETNSAANPKTTHTYDQPGTVNVRLRVTDTRGVADVVTQPVTVQPRPANDTDRTAPRLRILTSSARLSRAGIVGIRIACPATERSCTGRLALRSLGARATALGGKAFTLGGGQSTTVRVKLASAKRRLVRRQGRVRTLASARVRDAAGNTGKASKRLVVRR